MAPSACVICNKSSSNACAVCKSTSYCSRSCQTVDWPLHRTLCKKFLKLPPRPKTPSRLAFLLSADSPNPEFVWVPCVKVARDDSLDEYESPVIEALLGDPSVNAAKRFNIEKNELRGYTLDHTVVMYARSNWLGDGSKPNQAALALTDWDLPFDWRGNILVMSYPGFVENSQKVEQHVSSDLQIPIHSAGDQALPVMDFQNISMADLRIAVDYLASYGKHIERGMEHLIFDKTICHTLDAGVGALQEKIEEDLTIRDVGSKQTNVTGVIIRCEGDIGLHREQTGILERYSELEVPRNHAVWKKSPTEASKMMGLSIIVHKMPANPAWDKSDHTRFDNQPATFLNITVDPRQEEMWGFAPPEWQFEVGSVLLVRKDGKDLSREQGWALAEYMQFIMSDAMEEAMESGEEKERRAVVLKILNWKSFDTWLEDFKIEMTTADKKSWKDVQSPFGTKQ